MALNALIFGAIGTLAETSDLQREAFNRAFRQSGLDWDWDAATYQRLLQTPGGARRIADEARSTGVMVDAAAVHSRKVANFRALVLERGIALRPGVADTLAAARAAGLKLGWATSTNPQTVALIREGLGQSLPADIFDHIGDSSDGRAPKPAPDAYLRALSAMGVSADAALAVEDTPESATAALAAGLACIAFAGEAAALRQFPPGCIRVEALSPALLHLKMAA
ncbi:MAG: HAD-IA family hydrolase [Pseudomonadota bacterium]